MKLSICIPTYNFAKFIGATLDSIIPQLNDEIEVVILDGASTDNTEEIVRSYRERHPQIRYFRESKRGGIDKDMHLSIEKAKGEYCWLFSSDDLIKKGALEQVLAEIKLGLDVYVCGFTICSFDMASVIQEYRFSTLDKPTTFDLSKQDSRRSYFESALATPTFFSFMSSLIIKRKRWIETPIESSFFNTCWAHAKTL